MATRRDKPKRLGDNARLYQWTWRFQRWTVYVNPRQEPNSEPEISVIIFRYLGREVLLSMAAVSGVSLLIDVSGRFVKYLAEAASGKLAANALLAIIGFRLPGFLELILPLGLFIGFLLAYGRLYMDSELTVLSACGFSSARLITYSLFPACLVAALVAALSLIVSPYGVQQADAILKAQKNRNQFDYLTPAQFHYTSGGNSVTYAASISDKDSVLQDVFIAELNDSKAGDESQTLVILKAKTGEQIIDPDTGERYLKFDQGARYVGGPGELDFEVLEFASYAQHLPQAEISPFSKYSKVNPDALPTAALVGSDDPKFIAALHWRYSLPCLVLVVTLLAVPLSKTNPRQGRYVQLLPAILLYVIYLVTLNAARGKIEDGQSFYVLWGVHGGFFLLALIINLWPRIRRGMASGGQALA